MNTKSTGQLKRSLLLAGTVTLASLSVNCMARADPAPAGTTDSYQADNQELSKAKSSLGQKLVELRRRIDNYSQQIQTLTDVDEAQKSFEDLQSHVSDTLGDLSDNGRVVSLCNKVISAQQQWLALTNSHTYDIDKRQKIVTESSDVIGKTQQTIDGITDVRHEITSFLKRMQQEQQYISDVKHLRSSKEMLVVLQGMLHDLRDTSTNLHSMMTAIPGV